MLSTCTNECTIFLSFDLLNVFDCNSSATSGFTRRERISSRLPLTEQFFPWMKEKTKTVCHYCLFLCFCLRRCDFVHPVLHLNILVLLRPYIFSSIFQRILCLIMMNFFSSNDKKFYLSLIVYDILTWHGLASTEGGCFKLRIWFVYTIVYDFEVKTWIMDAQKECQFGAATKVSKMVRKGAHHCRVLCTQTEKVEAIKCTGKHH